MNLSSDPILHWLLRLTVEGGLLILLVLALRRAFPRNLTAGWRIALWIIVGVKLLVPASLPVGAGFGKILRADAPVPSAVVVQDKELGRPRPESQTRGEGAPAPWNSRARVSVSSIILGVWTVGIVTVIALLLIREARFRRSLVALRVGDDREFLSLVRECAARCDARSAPGVRLLPEGCGPAVAGLFAPVLLLPSDWRACFDRDSLRHVIFHEMEHVRSHDLVWNWVAALVTAGHWFNPLVWLAAARFQSDRELRCDARAVERMGPADRVAYGRTLLRISETFLAPPATAGLAPCVRHHPSLRHRLTMITHPPTSSPALHALSAGAFGLVVCLSFGSARAQDDAGKKPNAEETLSRQLSEAKPVAREGERVREGDRPKEGERDGQRPKEGERMRDGDRPKSGPRDGEQPRTGERDGERPRSGPRDGEQPRTGPRDEGGRKPEGERGEGRERAGDREGGAPIEIQVLGQGNDVKIAGQTVAVNQLRGFLQGYLADKKGRPVIVDADPATPYSAVAGVLDAARDNGVKNVQLRGTKGREQR